MHYWIFAVLYFYSKDFFGHRDILLPSSQRDEAQGAAFLLGALPGILGLTGVAIINAVLGNVLRLVTLCVWFLYLCFSERIRRVFQTKDSGVAAAKQISS
jgi:hypothetical protein